MKDDAGTVGFKVGDVLLLRYLTPAYGHKIILRVTDCDSSDEEHIWIGHGMVEHIISGFVPRTDMNSYPIRYDDQVRILHNELEILAAMLG